MKRFLNFSQATAQLGPHAPATAVMRLMNMAGQKHHGWAGARRKLKKSHQDHQRPRRRRI